MSYMKKSDSIADKTNFDCAVVKFGYKKILKMLHECMPPADKMWAVKNLYPFMIAASYKISDDSVTYQLSRQILPSLVDRVENHVDHVKHSSKNTSAAQ